MIDIGVTKVPRLDQALQTEISLLQNRAPAVANVMDTKSTAEIMKRLFDPIEALSFGELASTTKSLTYESLVNICEEALEAKIAGGEASLQVNVYQHIRSKAETYNAISDRCLNLISSLSKRSNQGY